MAFIRSQDDIKWGDQVTVPDGLSTHDGRYTTDHTFNCIGCSEDQRDVGVIKLQDPETLKVHYISKSKVRRVK